MSTASLSLARSPSLAHLPLSHAHLPQSHTPVTALAANCSLQVEEYDGLWKPKHHFATHVPIDVLRFGPPRGYWCMSFEGFNKLVKQATEISNYRQEDLFVLEHWIMKSARVLRRKRDAKWRQP